MELSLLEAKVTVAKLLELAYSKDKGMTVKIMAEKGNAKLTMNLQGDAVLSGSVGIITFSGNPVLNEIGAKIKRVSITFTNKAGRTIGYSATYNFEVFSTTVSGDFNLEELITSCSGLLCKAARAIQNRHHAYEQELQKIMGQ